MRIALISDIHGNYTALEAVLTDIRRQSVEALVCLGDVATLGPQPRLALAAVREAGALCIQGNHDAALLDLERAADYLIAPPLLASLDWCARQLSPADFDFLRAYAPTADLELGPQTGLRCFHGSPRSNIDLILAVTPPEELDRLLGPNSAAVLAGGHSHIQMLRQHYGRWILNPGSVGCPFARPAEPNAVPRLLPWAEYAVLEWQAGALSVHLRRVMYDLRAFLQATADSELPMKAWWLGQAGLTASLGESL